MDKNVSPLWYCSQFYEQSSFPKMTQRFILTIIAVFMYFSLEQKMKRFANTKRLFLFEKIGYTYKQPENPKIDF